MLLSSIAEDPDYFEPKVLLVADYYNEGEYNKADSLNRLISTQTGITGRQLNLLNSYDALIKGDNRRVYARMGEEYNRAPWEIFTNTSMMVLSLQFVNRPEDVAEYYSKVDMSLFDLANCRECVNRLIIKTDADLELGKYSEVVRVLDSTRIQIANRRLDENLLMALIHMGDTARSRELLQEIRISNESDWKTSGLRAAQAYLMMDDRESAVAILAEVGRALENDEHVRKGKVSFLLQDYSVAAMHYQKALEADSTNYELKAEYAISLFRSGKQSEAVQLIQSLESDREPYQYGEVDYTYAQFYAGVGDVELAFAYLKKSIAAGYFFLRSTYGNDLLFNSLKGDPRFEEILTYWH